MRGTRRESAREQREPRDPLPARRRLRAHPLGAWPRPPRSSTCRRGAGSPASRRIPRCRTWPRTLRRFWGLTPRGSAPRLQLRASWGSPGWSCVSWELTVPAPRPPTLCRPAGRPGEAGAQVTKDKPGRDITELGPTQTAPTLAGVSKYLSIWGNPEGGKPVTITANKSEPGRRAAGALPLCSLRPKPSPAPTVCKVC